MRDTQTLRGFPEMIGDQGHHLFDGRHRRREVVNPVVHVFQRM